MFRINGEPALGLAIAMRDGGDTLALGRNVASAIAAIKAELPHGIEPRLVADQPLTVDLAINEFTTSLWSAIGIVLVISFVALGVRAGTVVAIAIPLTLAVVFPMMNMVDIDLQRVSLGALIIALALMVDDAMTSIDDMSRRLAAGDDKASAATYAYKHLAFAMLIGTLVTIAGFVPIGFAQSSAGEYTFSIFAVVGIALLASWFVAMVFLPAAGRAACQSVFCPSSHRHQRHGGQRTSAAAARSAAGGAIPASGRARLAAGAGAAGGLASAISRARAGPDRTARYRHGPG